MSDTKKTSEEIELSTETTFGESVQYGVTRDVLNVKSLALWSLAGIVLFLSIFIAVFNGFYYNRQKLSTGISEQSVYFEKVKSRTEATKTLNTYGIVDVNKGIYRIPVDSAMTLIVNEYKK